VKTIVHDLIRTRDSATYFAKRVEMHRSRHKRQLDVTPSADIWLSASPMPTPLAFTAPLALAAALIDISIGYPEALFRRVGHPVVWMGALLGGLEARLNRPGESFAARRAAGVFTLIFYLSAVGLVAAILQSLAPPGAFGFVALALVASCLPARQSLDRHVRAVANALERGGLPAGRLAVSKIVGRNPEALDEAGVARAAIESLAENYSDGVVAPLFWLAIGGLVGAALYKAINTADSMIGHRNERYHAFGWAAARLDDVVNLPASRLTALWLVIAAGLGRDASARDAWRAVFKDARKHRSPNAGYPEAAMAGALGLKLAGPRVYGRERIEDCFMGDGRYAATAQDIRRALGLYRRAAAIELLALGGLALLAQIV
jgi:adenosylcobinamide-phosphate synthase